MKPEEINIAIAEVMGWKVLRMRQAVELGLYKPSEGMQLDDWDLLYGPDGKKKASSEAPATLANWVKTFPDFFNDLNARHEAWKTLDGRQKFHYRSWISTIAKREGIWAEEAEAQFGYEAFLRTIGKWRDQ